MTPRFARRLAAAFFLAYAVFLTYPGILPFNRARPFVLGIPFTMFWVALWVVLGFVVFVLLDRSRNTSAPSAEQFDERM